MVRGYMPRPAGTAPGVPLFTRHSTLSALEILVRLKQTNDIQPFYARPIEISDDFILTPNALPVCWKRPIAVSRAFADAWLKSSNSPALCGCSP